MASKNFVEPGATPDPEDPKDPTTEQIGNILPNDPIWQILGQYSSVLCSKGTLGLGDIRSLFNSLPPGVDDTTNPQITSIPLANRQPAEPTSQTPDIFVKGGRRPLDSSLNLKTPGTPYILESYAPLTPEQVAELTRKALEFLPPDASVRSSEGNFFDKTNLPRSRKGGNLNPKEILPRPKPKFLDLKIGEPKEPGK